MATSSIKKGLVSMFVVFAGLGISKVASAADCQPTPYVKVDGVMTSAITPVVIHGSGTLTVRWYCDEDKTSGMKADESSMSRTKDVPKAEWILKTGGLRVKILNAYTEFEGTQSGKVGETRTITFKDGSGASYTVNVQFADSYANQGAVDALGTRVSDVEEKKADKADVDKKNKEQDTAISERPTVKEGDDRWCGKDDPNCSSKGDGRYRFWVAPEALFRPGFGPSGGAAVYGGIGFGNPTSTIFELGLFGSYTFLGGAVDVRPVQGVPTTSPIAHQRVFTLGILPSARIPAGKIVEFTLGAGLGYQNLQIDEHTVGTIAGTEQEWFWNTQYDHSLLLMGNIGLSFKLSETPSPVMAINVGFMPAVQLIPTRKRMGGEDKTHKVDLPLMAGVGGEF